MTETSIEKLLVGDSEMHRLTREFNWADSPVGLLESWPVTLQTAVSICLDSCYPMWVGWGRELITFYNDGYRDILGPNKHPGILSGSFSNCWPEVWPTLKVICDDVWETGKGSWSDKQQFLLMRNGYLEETYFTYSFSSIRTASGEVVGMFCACNEETQDVLAVRHQSILRRLAGDPRTTDDASAICQQVFDSSIEDLPFALVYLLDQQALSAQLKAISSLEVGTQFSPEDVHYELNDPWLFSQVLKSKEGALVQLNPSQYLPQKPWGEAPQSAYVLPIMSAGQSVVGFLVAGLSPRRAFDDTYRIFLEAASSQIATLFSAATAYEEERQKSIILEKLVQQRTEEVQQANEELRALIHLVSEQIQGPANVISSYLGLLAVRYKDRLGKDADEFIDKCTNGSSTVNRIVDDLWHFARVDKLQIEADCLDLEDIFERSQRALQDQILAAGGTVIRAGTFPHVRCNADQMNYLFRSLIVNSLTYARIAEPPRLEISCIEHDHFWEFCFSDNGIGLDSMQAKEIFKPFVRINGRPGEGGTGMGLAISQRILEAHGGKIWVESMPSNGAKFFFTLPKTGQ